jgi:hypothetical protein
MRMPSGTVILRPFRPSSAAPGPARFSVSDALRLEARVWKKRNSPGRVDPMTLARLIRVSNHTNLPLVVTQGSGRDAGLVHADSPGIVDLRVRGYTASQVVMLLRSLERHDFATSDLGPHSRGRGPGRSSGFDRHIHAVLASHPNLSADALRQVESFQAREVIPGLGRSRPYL